MIIYSVEITIEAEIESEWLDWMQRVHVPDVLGKGCFNSCRIQKLLDAGAAEPVYVLQYECESLETYYRYRDNFAPAMQKEHTERYAGRFRGARRILEVVGELG